MPLRRLPRKGLSDYGFQGIRIVPKMIVAFKAHGALSMEYAQRERWEPFMHRYRVKSVYSRSSGSGYGKGQKGISA